MRSSTAITVIQEQGITLQRLISADTGGRVRVCDGIRAAADKISTASLASSSSSSGGGGKRGRWMVDAVQYLIVLGDELVSCDTSHIDQHVRIYAAIMAKPNTQVREIAQICQKSAGEVSVHQTIKGICAWADAIIVKMNKADKGMVCGVEIAQREYLFKAKDRETEYCSVFVKPSAIEQQRYYWPIPEDVIVKDEIQVFPIRITHPILLFKPISPFEQVAVDSFISGKLGILADRYEIEFCTKTAEGLLKELKEKHPNEGGFIVSLRGINTESKPFGYVRLSNEGAELFILPYDFIVLAEILESFQIVRTISADLRKRMMEYLLSIPFYYIAPLNQVFQQQRNALFSTVHQEIVSKGLIRSCTLSEHVQTQVAAFREFNPRNLLNLKAAEEKKPVHSRFELPVSEMGNFQKTLHLTRSTDR
jgi:hypothetical protein